MRWLREIQGVETVVLLGNSGGGSLMAAYQAQAVDPNVTPLDGMRPAAGLTELLPADGYVASAAHPGRPDVLTAWMDASVVDENDAIASDPDLDLFDERNGPPYSAEFVERYRAAQVARNHAITDWAENELKRVRAAGFSDRPFTVLRTWADPRMVDPTIEPTKRPANMCYAGQPGEGQPVGARHRRRVHAAQLAGHVEPSARADPRRTASRPHRLPRPGDQRRAGHGSVPVDAQRIHDALASTDKTCTRSTPTITSPRPGPAARRPIPSPSGSRSGGGEGVSLFVASAHR